MSRSAAAWWVFLLSIPTGFWYAFCVSKIWTWFVVPLGAPSLGVVRIAGISCIIAFFRNHDITDERPGADILANYIVNRILFIPSLLLLFAWFYSHFL